MGYELHLERWTPNEEVTPIPLSEWARAVAETPGVRLCAPVARSLTVAPSGPTITMPWCEGDAEVYCGQAEQWRFVFRWSEGAVQFRAGFMPGDCTNPVWVVAVALARRLNARVRGDEGEFYDLESGEPRQP